MGDPTDLARRLGLVCLKCKGTGRSNPPARVQCWLCSGTGLDPERVEMLREFERETLGRAARVCREQLYAGREEITDKTVAAWIESIAAAIEAAAKETP